ncbi:PcfB family protein [Clostridium sp. Cult3]|uniref:PcfB family protein n=1 Tax=Clostridium sp. Cult3 TaxID=2079004 RepID=UPI001F41B6E8|nr:PcfB family protein [Clostridium sp. Cult3]
MQEEVTEKSIAFVAKNNKMTLSVLKTLISAYLKEKEKQKISKGQIIKRKKISLKELSKKYDGLKSIEINEDNIKGFEKTAKKYGIEYALKKDKTTDPPIYIVFFKGKDTDILDTAFREFIGNEMDKDKRPSLKQALNKMKEISKSLNKDKVKKKHQEQSL